MIGAIKEVSLYTCLYITNKCINDCGYCGYKKSNNSLNRIILTAEEVRVEAIAIRESGVNNVIIIGGTLEENEYKDLILETTKIALEEGLIPWIEFENLSFETLKELKAIGANHFILFQETYNEKIFSKLHQGVLKKNFSARLEKMNEAINAGFKNIGIGALFGLTNNFDFEIQELCKHAKALQNKG
nr:radical SAM protein [archaeon]